jgi:hypothetical protein
MLPYYLTDLVLRYFVNNSFFNLSITFLFVNFVLVSCMPQVNLDKGNESSGSSSSSTRECTPGNYGAYPTGGADGMVSPFEMCGRNKGSTVFSVQVNIIKTSECEGGYSPPNTIEYIKCYVYFGVPPSAGNPVPEMTATPPPTATSTPVATPLPTPDPTSTPDPDPDPTSTPVAGSYFDNPLFGYSWHLNNSGAKMAADLYGGVLDADLNVIPVWNKDITGEGVTVLITDDGIDITHPDLRDNIDKDHSKNMYYDPYHPTVLPADLNDPQHDLSDPSTGHGTSCTGLIGASNNRIGGVGVAYNATLSGYNSLAYQNRPGVLIESLGTINSSEGNQFDVYNNSFGYGVQAGLLESSADSDNRTFLL